jgi:hypothetical protein
MNTLSKILPGMALRYWVPSRGKWVFEVYSKGLKSTLFIVCATHPTKAYAKAKRYCDKYKIKFKAGGFLINTSMNFTKIKF